MIYQLTIPDDFFLAITFIYIVDVLVRFCGLGWHSFKSNGWNLFDVVVASGSFITTLLVRFSMQGQDDFVLEQLQKLFLVSIAFKLVQRTNSLNKLFKTAMYVSCVFCPHRLTVCVGQACRLLSVCLGSGSFCSSSSRFSLSKCSV